jgi:hypothetical protein
MTQISQQQSRPRMIHKQVISAHQPGRAPLCAFITYIDPSQPVLLRRLGWELSSDIHDDFTDAISADNGNTWSEPRRALSSRAVDGGHIVHTENAVLYLPERRKLIHFTNEKFEPSLTGGYTLDHSARIRITVGDPETVSRGTATDVTLSDFGFKQGIYVSFANPFLDSKGRVLLAVMWQRADPDRVIQNKGFPARADMPDVLADYWDVGLLIGEFGRDGQLAWRVSRAVPFQFEQSSRGLAEGAVEELRDGRLAMILRASNQHWLDRPNYKWLSFSADGGDTWSEIVPLACDDGVVLESSATGSALFHSLENGKLHWIGNLCQEGERAQGSFPRSPLYIAEMQEQPFAIKRGTITVIDQTQPGEHPNTQHSNFKFYQDRQTGDVVLSLTRYGERGYDPGTWLNADLYQYRIRLDERPLSRSLP